MEEEEESSDGEAFRLVGQSKRRKTGEVIVEDGKEEEILLNSNKFSPLEEEEENNNNPAGESGELAGKRKQPPLVVKDTSWDYLTRVLHSCKVKPDAKCTRSGIKLTCYASDDFDTLQVHLKRYKVQFYTHGKRDERPFRAVLRGIPPVPPEQVKERLKTLYNLDALEVYAIKRKEEKPSETEIPYIVLFPKGHTNLKELRTIKKMGRLIIRWEAYRNKRPHVTQCKNCLHLGHGTRNCYLKARCNNCGGSHKTEKCKVEESQAKRCANCSGSHEGLDRNCPKRADFIRSRQQAAKPKPPVWKTDKRGPTEPAFNAADFPPLPDAVPVVAPIPTGSNQGHLHFGANKQHPQSAGSDQGGKGPRAGVAQEENDEEVLYSSAELWSIYTEFSTRLKRCKTRSEQGKVVAYLLLKFEVK